MFDGLIFNINAIILEYLNYDVKTESLGKKDIYMSLSLANLGNKFMNKLYTATMNSIFYLTEQFD